MGRIFILCLISISVSGCYSLSRYPTAAKVAAASTVEHDEYDGSTWVKAPIVWIQPGSRSHKAMLRALITEAGTSSTRQLYVMYEDVEWAFLERAFDHRGNKLSTVVVARDISGFGVDEHVAVTLTADYLAEATETGLDIQLIGRRGKVVVKLPGHYVKGFLDKLSTAGSLVAAP